MFKKNAAQLTPTSKIQFYSDSNKVNLIAEMTKVNNCKNYKEVVELLDEVMEYYRQVAQEKHDQNKKKMEEIKENRKKGHW